MAGGYVEPLDPVVDRGPLHELDRACAADGVRVGHLDSDDLGLTTVLGCRADGSGRLVAAGAITGDGRRAAIEWAAARDHASFERLLTTLLHHDSITVDIPAHESALIDTVERIGFTVRGTRDGSIRYEHLHNRFATVFDNDVANYESARPGYPPALFDLLAHRCGVGPGTRVLEIGPGTGQATLPLLDLGADVVAVEPGEQMARRRANERVGAAAR